MSCFDPFGETNSLRCQNVHPVVYQPRTLPNLRAVANDLVEGPEDIVVRHKSDARDLVFERVFRLLIRIPNSRIESWTVFRRERSWAVPDSDDPGAVLRHCRWDMKIDLDLRTWETSVPSALAATTFYVTEVASAPLGSPFASLDAQLQHGIGLTPRAHPESGSWQELSLWRAVDWGVVDLTWLITMENLQVEDVAFVIARMIESIIGGVIRQPDVSMLKMIYRWTPYLTLS